MAIALKHPKLFADKVNWVIPRENGVIPANKMTKAAFPSVVTSSKGLPHEECNLPMVHTSDGFDRTVIS